MESARSGPDWIAGYVNVLVEGERVSVSTEVRDSFEFDDEFGSDE